MQTKLKPLLRYLEKIRHLYWNINRPTGQFLNLLIREFKFKTVLEIGTSNGYSAIWLAEALTHNKGHLYTIESHKQDRYNLAIENFKKSGLKNITAIVGHAPQVIPQQPRIFDMAFLDATKFETIDYFKAIEKRIKKDGIIVTDNINTHKKDLLPFMETLKNSRDWASTILNIGSGLMISQKRLA